MRSQTSVLLLRIVAIFFLVSAVFWSVIATVNAFAPWGERYMVGLAALVAVVQVVVAVGMGWAARKIQRRNGAASVAAHRDVF